MGSTSKHGRAVINARAPEALGICDRCGFLYNLRSLVFQWDWAGSGMVNRQIRVCTGPGTRRCLDRPQEQLRAIILPPDPMPARLPRPEAYDVDERSVLDIRKAIGAAFMFPTPVSFAAPRFITIFNGDPQLNGVEVLDQITGSPNRPRIDLIMSGGVNTSDVTFTEDASAEGGTLNFVAIFDAIVAGNMLAFSAVPAKDVNEGFGLKILAGNLTVAP